MQQFTLLVALLYPAFSFTGVNGGEYSPIISFNNGVVESGKTCSSTEWGSLKTAMGNALGPARKLRASDRNLGFCERCRLNPVCLATVGRGCAINGGRRRTQEELQEPSHMRKLSTNATQCDAQMTAIDAAFAKVYSGLADSCKALIDAPRDIDCAWFTHECDINHFSLWSGSSESMIIPKLNATDNSFCSSLGHVTLRAETHFFLGKVQFELKGPNNFTLSTTEYTAPYYMHGNAGSNVNGAVLAPGDYVVRAVSENDPAQAKSVSFTVENC